MAETVREKALKMTTITEQKASAAARLFLILGLAAGCASTSLEAGRWLNQLANPPQMSQQDRGLPQCDPEWMFQDNSSCNRHSEEAIRFDKYHPAKIAEERSLEGLLSAAPFVFIVLTPVIF